MVSLRSGVGEVSCRYIGGPVATEASACAGCIRLFVKKNVRNRNKYFVVMHPNVLTTFKNVGFIKARTPQRRVSATIR